MGEFCCSKLKSKTSFSNFSGFCAQICPKRETPVALLRAGLLLSFLCLCVCLDDECVLGIVGRPVALPCFSHELLNAVNVSIEWRRGDEVVLASVWNQDGSLETWSVNSTAVPADAPLTGNLSLKLPEVRPVEDKIFYSLFIVSGENQSTRLCTACLRTAASFSSPQLQREEAVQGDEKVFLCHATGGYPVPAVYWLINNTKEPPAGSVRTQMASLPDHLYNVTSLLTVNISDDFIVSCIIDNYSMNQTMISSYSSDGVEGSPVVNRASSAMWVFGTALCVVVGVMVIGGVLYQLHLDRMSKTEKEHKQPERRYKRQFPVKEEEELMESEKTDV
ncbi:ICOS ligand-like isoform X2 [Archocentrus centrarchus]|uniref:ICOS ligand-like isoform X2 n=1 Tax=Archocentrus centrarchus TaxID=63155 RepID=UPI0011EA119E|nr:ICOS ligand-like isoform X2 [Archocentrus centrarchus]